MDIKLSKHAKDMLKERNISEDWVWRTIENNDWKNVGQDGNLHYFKSIKEVNKNILHVVVDHLTEKIVTVFFDRRARK